jgi:hypothetical protein
MEVLYARCCGIDVHAKMLVACLIMNGRKETRSFTTMSEDLLCLLDWLVANKCRHGAIESTGVYCHSLPAPHCDVLRILSTNWPQVYGVNPSVETISISHTCG